MTYLAELDPVTPSPNSKKSLGDDEIRAIKQALRDSFPGFTGAVMVTGEDIGVSNTYVLQPSENLPSYVKEMMVIFFPKVTNGGASTLNISNLGAQSILRWDGSALANGDIMAGFPTLLTYTGTGFRLSTVSMQYILNLVISGSVPVAPGDAGKPFIADGVSAAFRNNFGVAMDEAEGAPIASASTINLSSGVGTGNFVHITVGSSPVNLMTLPGGAERTLVFDGAITLTNSANLILPTNADITTAAGDTAIVRGEGASVVRVVDYQRFTGRALVEPVSPGLYLIAGPVSVTVAAAVDFLNVFSATYDDYIIELDHMSTTAVTSRQLSMFFAKAGVVLSTGYTSQAVNSGAAVSPDFGSLTSCKTGDFFSAEIRIKGANNTDVHSMLSNAITTDLSGSTQSKAVNGWHLGSGGNAGAISGFRLTWSSGSNFDATGTVRVYGIKKA